MEYPARRAEFRLVSMRSPATNTGLTVRATWKGVVIAESGGTTVVEGNHYFPVSDVHIDLLRPSTTHTTCHWKGVASYFDVVVGDQVNKDAAWYYPDPSKAAERVSDRIAFWRGVSIEVLTDQGA